MKNKWVRLFVFGLLVWLIPFVLSFGFYDQNGTLQVSYDLFKSSMIVISAIVGCFLLFKYFERVDVNYKSEGLVVGIVWLLLNWVLDVFILVPFAKMEMSDYFVSIGLRYLQIPVISFLAGSLLESKQRK